MSTFWLKIIAILSMAVDHAGYVLFPQYQFMRVIGRLAFPIFAFLIANGYRHTKSPLKYAIRLAAFAVISEIPFDLAFNYSVLEFTDQNVFFTLLLGLLAIWGADTIVKKGWHPLLSLLPLIVCAPAAYFMKTDYSWMGVVSIFAFYICGSDRLASAFGAVATGVITTVESVPMQLFSAFAAIPIGFYNGKKGPKLKYLFYAFYPVHLLIIWLIYTYVM